MSCSLHDVVPLEAKGVPTAAVCTEPFRDEVVEQSAALGMPDYCLIEVPHPIQSLTDAEVIALADGAIDRIVTQLCLGPTDGGSA